MERTKWLIVPIAGLAAVSIGLGWWGNNQYSQKTTMAAEIDSRYSNSFHELASHIQDLQQEIGKARISQDKSMFQERLRSIWRLSGLAQDEVGKIPLEMMPLHNIQTDLATISKQTNDWLGMSVAPKTRSVQSGLDRMYKETGTMLAGMDKLQSNMLNRNLHWTTALAALNKGKKDNQIVDGFRKMDKSMGAFVEGEKLDAHPAIALPSFKKEKSISEQTARAVVTNFFKGESVKINHVDRVHHGQLSYDTYNLSGKIGAHDFAANVSRPGGHLLYYHIDSAPAKATEDLGAAQKTALTFLRKHGFSHLSQADAYQFDNTEYIVYNPVQNGAAILNQNIAVEVGLDGAHLPLGLNAQPAYVQPVTKLAPRKYTTTQLRRILNQKGHVEMTQKTIVLDKNNRYQPAVSFFVTRDERTYRVDVNAATSQEIDTTDLSTR